MLYTDFDKSLPPERKNLAYVYQLLTRNSEKTLSAMFERLPMDHPARAPFNLFAQSSDTVKSGIILGLGTRLQVLQNEAVKQLVSYSDIDLTAPGSHKCAYYIILSDQETSMAFLSSLFFSFLFIKLTRFADLSPEGRCPVPVNLVLDEFNNIGRIGGAPDGSDFCRSLSVIRSRDIRVMIAVQSLGQLQNRYPNNLWSEIIGNCDIDSNTGLAVGSRNDAMMRKRRHYYLNTNRDGTYRIYEGLCCEARVMSVIPDGIFIDLFGIDSYIPLRELSYVRLSDAMGYYEPGQRVLVKIIRLDRSDSNNIRVAASVKQVASNPVEKALEKIEVGSSYGGTVTMLDRTGIFVHLDMGAECRCKYPYRARPPKNARVIVKIAGINMSEKMVWGNITYVTIPK